MATAPNLGTLLRRLRREKRISQAQLARDAGVSQAVVSYYERGMNAPSPQVAERIEAALGLARGELAGATGRPRSSGSADGTSNVEPPRGAFVGTLGMLPGPFALLDLPADADGGDLAFAVDLRSHVYLVVVDGQGSGLAAAASGRLAAACAFGATMMPGGGVPTPEDVVEAVLRFGRAFGSPGAAGICAVAFERRSRTMRMCRHNVPAPYLRSERLALWTGKPEGPGGAFVGERQVADDALLLVATDGVASMATSTGQPLWKAPDLRTLLAKATEPDQVADALRKRAGALGEAARRDDMLAVVVMPWRS